MRSALLAAGQLLRGKCKKNTAQELEQSKAIPALKSETINNFKYNRHNTMISSGQLFQKGGHPTTKPELKYNDQTKCEWLPKPCHQTKENREQNQNYCLELAGR